MQQASTIDPLYFLPAGSEMGALIRQQDWSQTPIGSPESWPPSLRTLLHMMLTSRFPMLIFWGSALTTFYNDAFRPSLGNNGKHPASLGQRGEQSWAESWPVIGPMIWGIMAGGEAVFFEDQKLPIYREGQMGYAYWTYSFSPLTDDTGAINGVLVTCSETTQAVESRQQLEASDAFARMLITNSPVASIVYTGPDMVIRSVNEAMLSMLGRDASIMNQPFMQVMPELQDTPLTERLQQVFTTGQPYYQPEERFDLIRYGKPYTGYYNYIYSALISGAGEPEGVVGTAIEVTDQVLARQQVAQNEQLLSAMIQQTPVGLSVVSGPDNVVEQANPALSALWNRPAEQVLGKPLLEAIPEMEGQAFGDLLNSVRKTGQPFVGRELPVQLVRHGHLETAYFDFVYEPLPNLDGSIDRVMVVANEVTEQLLARHLLEKNQQNLQRLLQQAPVAISIMKGPDHVIELANERMLNLWGRRLDDVLGKPTFEVFAEARGQGFEAMLDAVYSKGEPFRSSELTATIVRNGKLETIYVDVVYEPMRDADLGTVVGILQVNIDVTEQVVARQKLKESEARFRSVVHQSPAATLVLRGDDFIIDQINTPMLLFMGRGEEVVGQPMLVVMPELAGQFAWEQVQRVYREGVSFDQHEIVVTHNRTGVSVDYYYDIAYRPLREGGQITGMIQVATDVTEQMQARLKLEASEKQYRQLATELEERVKQRTQDLERSNLDLMQFASVASHDLKEPIRKVHTFGTMLREKLADRLTGDEEDLFRRLVNSSIRMQVLIDDVLRLSKFSDVTASYEPVDLNAVIRQIRDDLELIISEQTADFQAGRLPTIQAEPTQMHQLFLNLISNALKFQDGRTPVIRVEPVSLTGAIVAEMGLPNANYAVIAVSDNGIGFAPQYKNRIFGLFQRLHGRSRFAGTGIGLTIVKKIAENHQGYIDVQSQPDVGTTFRVALPLTPTPAL